MHTLTQLDRSYFEITYTKEVEEAGPIFSEWGSRDRFGIIIDEPLGGVGASHLIQLAICAFYDTRPKRSSGLDLYPEIYAIHLGRGYGSHAEFDFWPPRREMVFQGDAPHLLSAILDRGITHLALPDRGIPSPRAEDALDVKEVNAFIDTVTSVFLYSPHGRVESENLTISGIDQRTETNPEGALKIYVPRPSTVRQGRIRKPFKEFDPQYEINQELRSKEVSESEAEVARAARRALRSENGLGTETYRMCSASEALDRLVAAKIDDTSV